MNAQRSLVRLGAIGVLLCLSPGACVTDGPPPRQRPRPIQEQPAGLTVDRIVPAIDKLADDTDRNGYYDTFRVAVFLFSSNYTQSIQADGVMEFRLTDPATGKDIAKWVMDDAALKRAWGMSGVMPGYNFLLNMNQVGTDHVQTNEALFSCSFRPTNSAPVSSLSRLVVTVGPLR